MSKKVNIVIFALLLFVTAGQAHAQFNLGPVELLYTDGQLPFTMDGSFATLKKDATTVDFFHSYGSQMSKYNGTPDDPLRTQVWVKNGEHWNMQGYGETPWLYNIYKVDNTGKLLGFLHMEGVPGSPTGPFRIGLGYSTDNGDHWTYLGHIIKPQNDTGNIGGVPYLVVGQYFYVYYNEYDGKDYGVSVARAPVNEVLQAAAAGTVTPWKKYSNGAWDQDGLSGLGSNIIPEYAGSGDDYDVHADAAYNTVLGEYLLTTWSYGLGKLFLYRSSDGINWGNRIVLDETPGVTNLYRAYSTFVSLAPDATDDMREVGSDFYIIYPRKDKNNYDYDELYRRRLTVNGGAPTTPTLTFSANPSTIAQGQSSTLSWSSTNATSCSAGGGWSGSKSTSGSQAVTPTVTTSYALACSGSGGTVTKSVTVTVGGISPPPPPSTKKGDLNNDSRVDVTDLGILLSNWNKTTKPPADLNQDGKVDVIDLGILLSNWG